MKVLQIGMGNNPGGVESFVMNYYRELVSGGVQFDFLCMYGKIAYEEEIKRLGGRIFSVPNVKKDYFGYVRAVRAVLKEGHYDAVHINMLSAANIVPLRLAHEAGIKKILAHSHNSSAPGLLRALMDRWNRPKIRMYADTFLACSKTAGQWLFGDALMNEGRVELLPNAIDVEKFLFSEEKRKNVRAEFRLGDAFVIGHVGRFELQKNHEAIIDTMAEIVKRLPEAKLLLIGDGELKEHIREKAEKAGIGDAVLFAGVRSDVADLLSAMDVFLFPSLFEGLPFTLVEAQANGLKCVISDTITEEIVLCEDAVTKHSLHESADVWAEAVLGYRGRKRMEQEEIREIFARAHFDIKKEADRLKTLYTK